MREPVPDLDLDAALRAAADQRTPVEVDRVPHGLGGVRQGRRERGGRELRNRCCDIAGGRQETENVLQYLKVAKKAIQLESKWSFRI